METFEYFWVEVDVERGADGGVQWFQTYRVRKDSGRRHPYAGIQRGDHGVVYKDMQTSEVFDPMTGTARGYVRHHEAGTTTYDGQVAWATEKYIRFLRYFARAQILNLLKTHRVHSTKSWTPERFKSVGDELLDFYPSLERLRVETGDAFSPTDDEPFMFIWYVLAALRGESGAREAIEIAKPSVFERWGWGAYDGFFKGLLG
jgi:hypothetical protein